MRVLVQNDAVTDPLPHLKIWLMCRRLQGDSTTRVLPDAGGALDQNYELMWAFEIIDEQYTIEQDAKANFTQRKDDIEALRQQLLQGA